MKNWMYFFPIAGLLIFLSCAKKTDYLSDSFAGFETVVEPFIKLPLAWIFVVSVGVIAIGGPRQAIAILFGIRFGFFTGLLYSTMLTLAVSYLTFLLARHAIRKWVTTSWPDPVNSIQRKFASFGWRGILSVRLFPIGSNQLTNVAAGAANIKSSPFLWASGLGFLPQMAIFSFLGSSATVTRSDNAVAILVLFLSILVSSLLMTKSLSKMYRV